MDNLTSQSILITGASGFIGSTLLRALAQDTTMQITALCRKPIPTPTLPNVRWLSADLRDADAVHKAFQNADSFDVVFHLAGEINQSTMPPIYTQHMQSHLIATMNLLTALSHQPLKRFIYVGSGSEYGNVDCPHSSQTAERPTSAYGTFKLATTRMLMAKWYSEGFPVTVVRPFLTYGNGQSPLSFLAEAMEAAEQQRGFLTTPGKQTRDFVSVYKVVSDLIAVSMDADTVGCIVNSCTGHDFTIERVLEALKTLFPGFQPQLGALPYRPTELMKSVGIPYIALSQAEAWQSLYDFLAVKITTPHHVFEHV